jgi:hypothetical protein
MNKLFCLLLLAGFTTQVLTAQQAATASHVDSSTPAGFISDDDGGVAQIVPADLPAPAPRKARAVPAMKTVQQVSIFLGSGWGDRQVRSRQPRLLDLAANGTHAALADLQKHSVEILPAAPGVEDFSNLADGAVNDLTLQRKLVEMLERKTISGPDANTVFVVFLAPGIRSTLGTHTAGKDYAAYHSVLNVEGGKLLYVVVPFQENADLQSAAAAQALADTVFNPNSN